SGRAVPRFPPPLTPPPASDAGLVPTEKFVAAPKLPVPVPNRIDTLPEVSFATARSSLPLPSKSPTATETGLVPTPKLLGAAKLPPPVPSWIDTLSELLCGRARSSFPSPLKSPTATERGEPPTLKFVGAPKVAIPHPAACPTRGGTNNMRAPASTIARINLPVNFNASISWVLLDIAVPLRLAARLSSDAVPTSRIRGQYGAARSPTMKRP